MNEMCFMYYQYYYLYYLLHYSLYTACFSQRGFIRFSLDVVLQETKCINLFYKIRNLLSCQTPSFLVKHNAVSNKTSNSTLNMQQEIINNVDEVILEYYSNSNYM